MLTIYGKSIDSRCQFDVNQKYTPSKFSSLWPKFKKLITLNWQKKKMVSVAFELKSKLHLKFKKKIWAVNQWKIHCCCTELNLARNFNKKPNLNFGYSLKINGIFIVFMLKDTNETNFLMLLSSDGSLRDGSYTKNAWHHLLFNTKILYVIKCAVVFFFRCNPKTRSNRIVAHKLS